MRRVDSSHGGKLKRTYAKEITHRTFFLCALCSFILLAGGCVNQRAEIAKYRLILDKDVSAPVPALMPNEELSLVRALLLANQDNENLMIRGEDFIQAMN